MSVGSFEAAKYEANSGFIFPCRAQPETKGLVIDGVANTYPAALPDDGLPTMRLSNGKRESGVTPRRVVVELTENGTGAVAGYQSGRKLTIPVFRQAAWDGYQKGATGTYLGIACVVKRLFPEDIK